MVLNGCSGVGARFVKKWGVCDTTKCQITSQKPSQAGGFCFPGNAKVISPSGPKDMAQLRIGDELLGFNPAAGKVEFTKVRAWLHRNTQAEATFTKLHTRAGDVVVSPGHNMAVGSPDTYAFAHDILAGSALITPNGTALVTSSSLEKGKGIYAPWTMTSNFYVGMGDDFFLAHSLANVHSRFESPLTALFNILEFVVPSIHEFDEGTQTDYLHPVARIFWSIVEVPHHHIVHEAKTHSIETKTNHMHPIGTLIASVAGVPTNIIV